MALTESERAALIAKMIAADGTISVDGLSASGPSISEILKLLEWDAASSATSQTTRPYRIHVFNSPGAIRGT